MSTDIPTRRKSKFVVRQFKNNDLLAVQQLFSMGFKQYKDGQTSIIGDYFVATKLKEDMRDVEENYLNVGGNFWVAEDTSLMPEIGGKESPAKIIGIVGILPRDTPHGMADKGNEKKVETPHKVFELQRMIVDKHYHGRGVAQLLIQELERFAFEQHNCSKVFLTTGDDNWQARRFYEKQHYRNTGSDSMPSKDFVDGSPDIIYKWQCFEKTSAEYFS